MDYIINGFIEAFHLLISGDPEIYQIVGLSLYVSFSSTIYSTVLGVPLGILLGIKEFRESGSYPGCSTLLCLFRRSSSACSPHWCSPAPAP